jgi:leucyl-tRNA---protein transferase
MHDEQSNDLIRFVAEPSPCPYLPTESAQLEYRVPAKLNTESLERLLERGWRRFGNYVFRPKCQACRKCRPLRIVLEKFRPSKSQRKALRRNHHIELFVTRPCVTDEHVALFNLYHRDMAALRGWPENVTSFQDYYESFIGRPFDFAREFQYRKDGRLIGIGIVDVFKEGLSSAYFYHDPAWRKLSPGTFSILTEIEWAKSNSLKYSYLGYWIHENQSMDYKARFTPHQLLEACVDYDEEPVWVPATD